MKYTDEQLDRFVEYHLRKHIGQGSPIGRWELVEAIFGTVLEHQRNDNNVEDRMVRDSVERLRNRGLLICDLGDGRGRFLASSREEYAAFRSRYGGRAFRIIETLSVMDKAVEHEFPNPIQPALL